MSTMTILGAPGEVFLLTHSAVRSYLGMGTTAQVSRIDPVTLETLEFSPRLEGGPMWPGGMAVHANGHIVVVYGRHAHKLNRQCQAVASYVLPVNEPYNSFVVLDNGLIVTKNLSDSTPAQLTTLHPDSFKAASSDVVCPEASIARLSAHGNTVYVVGISRVFRYRWHEAFSTIGSRYRLGISLPARCNAKLWLGHGDRRRTRLVHGQRQAQLLYEHCWVLVSTRPPTGSFGSHCTMRNHIKAGKLVACLMAASRIHP